MPFLHSACAALKIFLNLKVMAFLMAQGGRLGQGDEKLSSQVEETSTHLLSKRQCSTGISRLLDGAPPRNRNISSLCGQAEDDT
jgi:hypothetical protein